MGSAAIAVAEDASKASESQGKSQPTMILKSREHDSTSRGSPPISRDRSQQLQPTGGSPPPSVHVIPSSPSQNYQIAQSKHLSTPNEGNHSFFNLARSFSAIIHISTGNDNYILGSSENKLSGQLQMKTSMKLIDENMQWCEKAIEVRFGIVNHFLSLRGGIVQV